MHLIFKMATPKADIKWLSNPSVLSIALIWVVHGQLNVNWPVGQQVAVNLKKPFGHFFKISAIFFKISVKWTFLIALPCFLFLRPFHLLSSDGRKEMKISLRCACQKSVTVDKCKYRILFNRIAGRPGVLLLFIRWPFSSKKILFKQKILSKFFNCQNVETLSKCPLSKCQNTF